jgi:hypothetical protein
MPKLRMSYVDDNGVELCAAEMSESPVLAASSGPMSIYCAGVHEMSDLWTVLARKISEVRRGDGMVEIDLS